LTPPFAREVGLETAAVGASATAPAETAEASWHIGLCGAFVSLVGWVLRKVPTE
jgi:hypothetical protein